MKLKSKKTIKYKGKVHDISVRKTATYNVEGLGVHNSAAGCLVSYLLRITEVDPIEHNLFFERFYNEGRNSKDRVKYPDIDIDFPKEDRDRVINYLKKRYGENRVAQMVTFGRMQGKNALKDVLRINGACSFEEMNQITKNIPDEASISDQLEESGETSIIRWALVNDAKSLSSWCKYDGKNYSGMYAKFFEQAIRLEGTYRSQGKHAAGIIISRENINEVCPMIRDAHGKERIAGWDMHGMEDAGHLKFDILGVDALGKLNDINKLLCGEFYQ